MCHTFFSTVSARVSQLCLHVMLASESLLNCDGLASASAAHQKTMEVLGIELLQNEHVSYVSAKKIKKKTATSKTECHHIASGNCSASRNSDVETFNIFNC